MTCRFGWNVTVVSVADENGKKERKSNVLHNFGPLATGPTNQREILELPVEQAGSDSCLA